MKRLKVDHLVETIPKFHKKYIIVTGEEDNLNNHILKLKKNHLITKKLVIVALGV